MQALVIGYGSIGQRHTRVLEAMGLNVAVLSRRKIAHAQAYTSLEKCVENHKPDYVVIASATSEHYADLEKLGAMAFKGIVLVEKPIFDHVLPLPKNQFSGFFVAYNLRYHPVLEAMKDALKGQTLCTAQIYVGQYLPTWRPDTDYRQSYSAKKNQGGGALLDLSHDLDYATWLMGSCRRLAACGGTFSDLDITSDDSFALLMELQMCPIVTVQLNYLDRVGRREILINTTTETLKADLVAGKLWRNDVATEFPPKHDETYQKMHEDVLMGSPQHQACKLDQGLSVVQLISAARQASQTTQWINL